MIIVTILAIWFICGIFSYGLSLAMNDKLDPEEHRENIGMSILMGVLGGPIPFLASLILGDYKKYGLKFR